MTIIELLKSALPKNQTEAAKLLNLSQPAIHKWMAGKGKPSPKSARAIEAATGGRVTCHQLRPDVFGPDPAPNEERAA